MNNPQHKIGGVMGKAGDKLAAAPGSPDRDGAWGTGSRPARARRVKLPESKNLRIAHRALAVAKPTSKHLMRAATALTDELQEALRDMHDRENGRPLRSQNKRKAAIVGAAGNPHLHDDEEAKRRAEEAERVRAATKVQAVMRGKTARNLISEGKDPKREEKKEVKKKLVIRQRKPPGHHHQEAILRCALSRACGDRCDH